MSAAVGTWVLAVAIYGGLGDDRHVSTLQIGGYPTQKDCEAAAPFAAALEVPEGWRPSRGGGSSLLARESIVKTACVPGPQPPASGSDTARRGG